MGRRRRAGLLEDIFNGLVVLPWWGGVIAAFVFWFTGGICEQRMISTPMTKPLVPLIRILIWILVGSSLLAAVVSAFRSAGRRRLLDEQKGIESIRNLTWRQFELLVGEAYRRQGYFIEETGGGGPDGGVDLRLSGRSGTILVQCKRWKSHQVGVDKVRELFGVVSAQRAAGGILITSGQFTCDAKAFAAGKTIELVDGTALAELVRNVQPNARPVESDPEISAEDEPFCALCGSAMILRTARRGANAGNQFYGCSRYPACKGTISMNGV